MMARRTTRYESGYVSRGSSFSKRFGALLVLVAMVAMIIFAAIPSLIAQDASESANSLTGLDSLAASAFKGVTAHADVAEDASNSGECEAVGSDDDSDPDYASRKMCGIKNGAGNPGDKKKNYDAMTDGDPQSDYMEAPKEEDTKGETDTSFKAIWMMVLYRTINPSYYMNSDIPDGQSTQQDDAQERWRKGRDCNDLEQTADYFNSMCDIPNMGTQAIQNLAYLILPSGIQGGGVTSGASPFGIGIPTNLIPGGTVPSVGNRGGNRYTALEVFGYNLKWTSYSGEWDKVDVLSADRLSANMSIFKEVWSSTVASFSASTDAANSAVSDAWNEGNLLKLATAIVSWPFKVVGNGLKGMPYYLARNIINTYEHGIVDSGNDTTGENKNKLHSWSRYDFYRNTGYNIRVLDDTEQAAVYRSLVLTMTVDSMKKYAKDHGIDISEYEKYEKLPAAPTVKVDKNASNEDKASAYQKAWDEWVEKNTGLLHNQKWTNKIDVSHKFEGKTCAEGAEKDCKENAPDALSDVYASLKEQWGKSVSEWEKTNLKSDVQSKTNLWDKIFDSYDDAGSQSEIKDAAKEQLSGSKVFVYCTRDDGTKEPAGNTGHSAAITKAMQAGIEDPGKEAFDSDGAFQCAGGMRPPISGALMGQSGNATQISNALDTRRTAYKGISPLDIMGNPLSMLATFFLGLSEKVAMYMNTMVNLSFEPLLDSLGIKGVVIGVVDALKKSLYINLFVMFIILGTLVVFVKAIKNPSAEGFKQILLVILSALLGVIVLYSPESAFRLVDEYPTYAERAMMAMLFETTGNPNADICTGTGSPSKKIDTSDYKSIDGSSTSFDPNGTVRMVECNLWNAYVFEPWSLGQFGTGHNQLYATGHATASGSSLDVSEDTIETVGSAGVDMGGGTTVHNWALYQISQQIGTTSTGNPNANLVMGKTSKNLYRLVDVQAGPSKASGRDTTYWGTWTGSSMDRLGMGVISLGSSIGGAIAITQFAFEKISATFMMSMLFAMAPIMLLIGIIPGGGRLKMQSWGWKMVSLALKRVVLVALLSLQLLILIFSANSNSSSAFSSILLMAAISIMFAMYGKSILAAFLEPIETRTGGFQSLDEKLKNEVKTSRIATDIRSLKDGTRNAMGAALGSVVAGGFRMQNSNRNILERYHADKRNEAREGYEKGAQDIRKAREKLRNSYSASLIPLSEYSREMSKLNDAESKINNTYKEALHAANQDPKFNEMTDILRDPKYRESNEGADALKRVARRMTSLNERRNALNGNVQFIMTANRATREAAQDQITSAFSTVMSNNPELAKAMTGMNKEELEKFNGLMDDKLDLREVVDDLGIDREYNGCMSADELANLPLTWKVDANGDISAEIPEEVKAEFKNAAVQSIRDAHVVGAKDTNEQYDEIRDVLQSEDENQYLRGAALAVADKYSEQNVSDMAQGASLDATAIDNLRKESRDIDTQYKERLNSIDSNASLTKDEIKTQREQAKQDKDNALINLRKSMGMASRDEMASVKEAHDRVTREMGRIGSDLSSGMSSQNIVIDEKGYVSVAEGKSVSQDTAKKMERLNQLVDDSATLGSYQRSVEEKTKRQMEAKGKSFNGRSSFEGSMSRIENFDGSEEIRAGISKRASSRDDAKKSLGIRTDNKKRMSSWEKNAIRPNTHRKAEKKLFDAGKEGRSLKRGRRKKKPKE